MSVVRRFWWAPIILVLGIAVAVQHMTILRKDAKLQHLTDVAETTVARINAGVEAARARDEANARRVETAQNTATQEASGEIEDLRARAAALAAAYIRMRNTTAGGGAGGSGEAGGTAKPAGAASGAGPLSLVDDDDLLVCTENTVRALGWRAWWLKISAIPR